MKKIIVQKAGCQLLRGSEFLDTVVSFMRTDPRIDISRDEIMQINRWPHNDEEAVKVVSTLNKYLGPIGTKPMEVGDVEITSNFYIPNQGNLIEVQLNSLGLLDILARDFPKSQMWIDNVEKNRVGGQIRSMLNSRPFDIRGICPSCDENLGINLRSSSDYDASVSVSPEQILELYTD